MTGQRSRRRAYLVMMSVCMVLFLLSWTVVVRFSATAAAALTIVAFAIPPVAVIVANRGDDRDERR
ncbi:DUF3099 domain-containing protein [Actinoallomurus sp. NPDC052274]|uniref:DUF3099 domain-containing protein n=1 Tax=Actinoallomurus sp. NPDC052274 TaxID=3155420 RepID=UPI00342B5BB6